MHLVLILAALINLGKYQDWPNSPQGYFMTNAERAEWHTLTTEAQAAKFIDAFLAKRAPDFAATVAERAAAADQYLTLGRTPGSKSLRGKVVILLGPPTSVYVTDRAKSSAKRDNRLIAAAHSNVGFTMLSDSGRSGDSASTSGNTLMTVQAIRTYAITFSGDAIAKTIDRRDVTFVIDADGASGKDELASRSARKDAQKIFELAARASIVKK